MAADRTTVMSTAVGTRVLHDFAEIARTELLVLDKTTTPRDFTLQVRWNQAYYRLAQGL
jgi:L-arabinose isomerase